MRSFVERHPLVLALGLAAASFGIAVFSVAASYKPVISNVQDIAPQNLVPPTEGEQAFALIWNAGTLFWILVALLSVGLLVWLGWWRQAGLGWPPRWRKVHLLAFPLLVGILALADGVQSTGVWVLLASLLAVLVAAFGEEALFRGLMLRLLQPSGLLKAVVATSLLAGVLRFGASTLTGPWPEAVQATVLATCGGFTYAALRWRTASIWPGLFLHALVSLAVAVSTLGATVYLILLFLSTFGFVAYGLFLLRNPRARSDGGPHLPAIDGATRDPRRATGMQGGRG